MTLSVRPSKFPSRHKDRIIRGGLVVAPHRLRRARCGVLSSARLRGPAGEKLGDRCRSLGMRSEFGFLPVANPIAARPGRMGLEEGAERREGWTGVGAQRRPFQRRSPGLVVRRLGERRQARSVALIVQDHGLRTARRRRRQGRPGRCRRGRGRRDRRERADHGRCARDVGVSELGREVPIASRNLLGQRRGVGASFRADAASRAEANRARRDRAVQGFVGRRGADGGERSGGRGSGAIGALARGGQPRAGVGCMRGRGRADARALGTDGALVERRDLGRRAAPSRAKRNQAGGPECAQ